MNSSVAEVDFREVVHIVPLLGLKDIVREHRVEHWGGNLDAVVGKHVKVKLNVLPHLHNFFRKEERAERIDDFLRFLPIGRHGHVGSLAFGRRKAHSYEFSIQNVQRSRFCVKSNKIACQNFVAIFAYIIYIINKLIIHSTLYKPSEICVNFFFLYFGRKYVKERALLRRAF